MGAKGGVSVEMVRRIAAYLAGDINSWYYCGCERGEVAADKKEKCCNLFVGGCVYNGRRQADSLLVDV